MQEILIGRDNRNGISYNAPSVGREHLKAIIYNNDEIIIEDQNATLGTFVDGRRIKRMKLLAEKVIDGRKTMELKGTTVKLGNFEITSATLIEGIIKSMGIGKSDFTKLFATKIAPEIENYEKKLAKLKSREYLIQNYRVIAGLLGGAIAIIAIVVKSESMRIMGMSISAITSVFFIFLGFKQKSKLDEKKQDLKSEYEEKIRCPKCRKTLLLEGTPLRVLKHKKRCVHPPCDAIFFK